MVNRHFTLENVLHCQSVENGFKIVDICVLKPSLSWSLLEAGANKKKDYFRLKKKKKNPLISFMYLYINFVYSVFLKQVLVTKFDKNKATMKAEEKKLLLETIKSLQAAIDTTRSQLVAGETPKSKVQVDREILDTELELYTVQAEGGDISKLRARLNQLRAQQQAAGYPASRSARHAPYSTARSVVIWCPYFTFVVW